MSVITDGLVLKVSDTGESDRLVTLLTADYGVVRAFANRAKKINSKMQAATQSLCYGSFSLYSGKDCYAIDSAEAKEVFFGLRQDIELLSLAQYFCSLAIELIPEGEPAPESLRVILNSLSFLQNGKRTKEFIKAVTEIKLMALAGFSPELTACGVCGENPDGEVTFSPSDGRFYCKKHMKHGSDISPGVLTAMRHIVASPVSRIYSFELSSQNEKRLCSVSEEFLLRRIGHGFRALDFYKTVTG